MATRPHRRLDNKQLSRFAAESWENSAALSEILAEIRQRPQDPVLDTLSRSIARRLSALHYRPPEKQAPARAAAPKGTGDASKRRRRAVAAVLAAGLLAGAWLLLGGDEPPVDQPGGIGPQASVGERPGVAGRNHPAALPVAETAPLRDLLPPSGHGTKIDGGTALARAERPHPARPLRIAEDGIYIGQRRLRCFIGDDDPERCGIRMWTQEERPAPPPRVLLVTVPEPEWQRAPARASFHHAAASASQPVLRRGADGRGTAPRQLPTGSRHDLRPPGDAAPVLAAPVPPPASTPQGGAALRLAGTPRPPAQPRDARPMDSAPADSPPPQCPPSPQEGRVVFILDASISMGLPLTVDSATEDRLDQGILAKDPEARQAYRQLLGEPGPKRMTRAREAFEAATSTLPPWVELGLVAFRECKDIRKLGIFDERNRADAIEQVRRLMPRGRTPLAQSLMVAAELLEDGPSSIVLLTDGREFCRGDPCASAAAVKSQHPDTTIHVVDISGHAKAECIAEATGGKVYAPAASEDLGRVLGNAFRGADAACPAP